MNEKIQVFNFEIDNCTVKDAMKKVVSFLGTEPLKVVEMVTMNTVAKFQDEADAGDVFRSFDITLASDKGILEAAGVEGERQLKEVDELLFIKMVMRFLHKNHIRVFLLAEDEADLQKLQVYMQEDYSNIHVIGSAITEELEESDDKVLNLLNGAEAQCVLSALPSPLEEHFVYKNKSLVNASIWLGFGNLLDELKQEKTKVQKLKDFILRQLLKKEMAKKGENA